MAHHFYFGLPRGGSGNLAAGTRVVERAYWPLPGWNSTCTTTPNPRTAPDSIRAISVRPRRPDVCSLSMLPALTTARLRRIKRARRLDQVRDPPRVDGCRRPTPMSGGPAGWRRSVGMASARAKRRGEGAPR